MSRPPRLGDAKLCVVKHVEEENILDASRRFERLDWYEKGEAAVYF